MQGKMNIICEQCNQSQGIIHFDTAGTDRPGEKFAYAEQLLLAHRNKCRYYRENISILKRLGWKK